MSMTTVANPSIPGPPRQPHTINDAPNQTMAINPYPLTPAPHMSDPAMAPTTAGGVIACHDANRQLGDPAGDSLSRRSDRWLGAAVAAEAIVGDDDSGRLNAAARVAEGAPLEYA